ncbi:MAG: response regulator [Mariprofundus sp.]
MTSSKILIVEDTASVRQAYGRFLTHAGYLVCEADNYDQSVNLIDDSIDLALLDVELDGKSGLDILAYIRNNHPHCPVIMMSGFADKQNTIEALRQGAVEYLEKPVNPHELVQSIKHWLSLRALQQENMRPQDIEIVHQHLQKNENRAQIANDRLNFLLATTGNAMHCTDQRGNTTFISENIVQICGYTADKFTIDPKFFINAVHPDDRDRVKHALAETLKSGQSSVEYRFLHQQGHYIQLTSAVKATQNSAGDTELTGLILLQP